MKKGLTYAEERLAYIIWEHEPVKSMEVVRLCFDNFGWKKSTTYTTLRHVVNKGIFKNENGIVSSLLSINDYTADKSKTIIKENFGGTLPKFFSAFTSKNDLSDEEIDELLSLIQREKEARKHD